MQYESFLKYIQDSFQQMKGETTAIRIQSVLKNNNVHYDALTIMPKGCNISPTIYLNDYYREYEEGTSLSTIIHEIDSIYESTRLGFCVDENLITDYEAAKEHIAFRLINYEENLELLSTIPHYRFLDLAQVFFILLDGESEQEATALITNEHLRMWDIDASVIKAEAERNAPKLLEPCFQSLESMMFELLIEDLKRQAIQAKTEQELSDEAMLSDETFELMARDIMNGFKQGSDSCMHVLTNKKRCHGAAAILYPGLLEALSEKHGSYYILPSSIHEVILLEANEGIDPETLYDMVHDVNVTEVNPLERLSDTVYYFDKTHKKLTICYDCRQKQTYA